MSLITAPPELKPESIPDAPLDQNWFTVMLDFINQLGRQLAAITNSTPERVLATYDLTDGQTFKLNKNPLTQGGKVVGIGALACTGLSVDGTGKPTGSVFDLAIPTIQWKYSGTAIWIVPKFATVGALASVTLEFRGE